MKKKIISKKFMTVMLIASLMFNPVIRVNSVLAGVEGLNSNVTIIQSSDNKPTNQDILITIETDDDLSGIKEITLPDGTEVTEKTTTYTITENGSYMFKVSDNAGNEIEGIVDIDNIDKIKPTLTLEPNILEVTNQDVIITARATDNESGIKEIILPDGEVVSDTTATFTVSENGSYTFLTRDNAGNETEEIIEITNIDKIPPVITIEPYNTEWTNQNITVTATVDKGTLNQESYTFTENGSFTFIATDIAGNVTEKIVTITNIDKVSPTMTIIIEE